MLKRSRKPIRYRSAKYGKPRGEWHPRRVRLSAVEMGALRTEAFHRSGGVCEMEGCGTPIRWLTFHLDHIVARGRGGSDEISNVRCLCIPCHRKRHGEPVWTRRAPVRADAQ